MGLLLICNILSLNSFAQSVGINDDDSSPNANAILDVKSTTKGFLVPRMTTSQRTTFTSSLATVDQAMLVFDTDLASFYYWNGSAWTALSVSSIKIVEDADGDTKIEVEKNSDEDIIRFDVRGTEAMVIDSLGNVGIGTSSPTSKLQIEFGSILSSTEKVMTSVTGSNSFSGSTGFWQSFTATEDGQLSKITIPFTAFATGTRTLEIFDGEGDTGTLLFTTAAVDVTGGGNVDFTISGVNITTNQKYTYKMDNSDRSFGDFSDPYAGGISSLGSFADLAFTVSILPFESTYFQVENDGLTIGTYKLPASDGTNGQMLITDGSGTVNWSNQTVDEFSLSGNTLSLSLLNDGASDYTVDLSSFVSDSTRITDTDGDTKIQVEESTDEDIIRFDVNGTERLTLSDGTSNIETVSFGPDGTLRLDDFGLHLRPSYAVTTAATQILTIEGRQRLGSSSPYARIDFRNTDNDHGATLYTAASIQSYNTGNSDDGDLRFYTTSDEVVSEAMRISFDGRVGIGTNSPDYLLEVGENGDGTEARANAWNTFSDRRWKTNFKLIDNPLKKLSLINGYYYDWKAGKDKSLQVGVIAQEIEAVLPEIVSTDSEGYKSVDYSKLTALLIEVNKAQQKEIDVLKSKLSEMEKLKAEVASIKALLDKASSSDHEEKESTAKE